MKQKVKFSAFSITITAAVLVLFVVGVIYLAGIPEKLTIFCIIFGGTTIAGLYFCPLNVEADDKAITLHRLASRPKVFAYDTIQAVDTCYPSAGGLRLCGCGGFFGYWGYFSDIMIGRYIGYYGSRDSCIVVKLKDGKRYVLGCENAVTLSAYINSRISR